MRNAFAEIIEMQFEIILPFCWLYPVSNISIRCNQDLFFAFIHPPAETTTIRSRRLQFIDACHYAASLVSSDTTSAAAPAEQIITFTQVTQATWMFGLPQQFRPHCGHVYFS